LKAKEGIIRRV